MSHYDVDTTRRTYQKSDVRKGVWVHHWQRLTRKSHATPLTIMLSSTILPSPLLVFPALIIHFVHVVWCGKWTRGAGVVLGGGADFRITRCSVFRDCVCAACMPPEYLDNGLDVSRA